SLDSTAARNVMEPSAEDSGGDGFIPAGITLRSAESPSLKHHRWTFFGGTSRMNPMHAIPLQAAAGLMFAGLTLAAVPALRTRDDPASVIVKLSEWKVGLSQSTVTAGTVTFTVANTGTVPHAFEVEGQGIEQETKVIQPGSSATLTLTLKPGNYDVYCPVGGDSHKHLGMETHLKVVSGKSSTTSGHGAEGASEAPKHDASETAPKIQAIR